MNVPTPFEEIALSRRENAPLPFSKREDPSESTSEREPLSAHCVQFVACPGQTEKLCAALDDIVSPMLYETPGFQGLVVLVSKREPRRVSVYSFARAHSPAATTAWEQVPAVKSVLRKMVDRCTSEDTHEAYVKVAPREDLVSKEKMPKSKAN